MHSFSTLVFSADIDEPSLVRTIFPSSSKFGQLAVCRSYHLCARMPHTMRITRPQATTPILCQIICIQCPNAGCEANPSKRSIPSESSRASEKFQAIATEHKFPRMRPKVIIQNSWSATFRSNYFTPPKFFWVLGARVLVYFIIFLSSCIALDLEFRGFRFWIAALRFGLGMSSAGVKDLSFEFRILLFGFPKLDAGF